MLATTCVVEMLEISKHSITRGGRVEWLKS
jgi:hypothetical protein